MLFKKKNKISEVDNIEQNPTEEKEMGFFDHLEEFRNRLIWASLSIVGGCIVSAVFIQDIISIVLLRPAVIYGLKLQNLKPFGQPMLYFKIILIVGIIVAFPFILYQLWRFIAPGLYIKERRWARHITFYTTLCFMSGVAFSYFVMIPSMLKFAASFGSKDIVNNIDVNEYLSFISMIVLAAGLLFEMPMVVFVLSRFGMLTPGFLRKYRRHSIIVILILAAVITPTPDPVSQLIFASPLFVLYEISILISKFAANKHQRVKAEEAAEFDEK